MTGHDRRNLVAAVIALFVSFGGCGAGIYIARHAPVHRQFVHLPPSPAPARDWITTASPTTNP